MLRHEYRTREKEEKTEDLEEDLKTEALYVRALLPAPISSSSLEATWCYIPTEQLGGDAFGYHWIDEDHFAMYLIDADNSQFSHSMKGDRNELTQCLRAAGTFLTGCALQQKARSAAGLTLEELLINAIKYGSPNGDGHDIRVEIDLDPIHVQITVEDNGIPFDPTPQPPPEFPTNARHAKVGGLGLEMIREMNPSMHYERNGSGNRITVSMDR